MAKFNFQEKGALENLFNRNGYVLEFSNRTFAEFLNDYDVDIYGGKYSYRGSSKMNRLRAFWETAPDKLVGKVFEGLLEYAQDQGWLPPESKSDVSRVKTIIARLKGEGATLPENKKVIYREDFAQIDLPKLNLNAQLQKVIQQRIDEIKVTIEIDAPLSIIFLCGSTLEGLLVNLAANSWQKFMNAKTAPDKKKVEKWSMKELIDVAHELRIIQEDAKEFSSSLWGFRNYIHPYRQAMQDFFPMKRTADMGWKALRAIIEDLSKLKDGKVY